MRRQMVTTMYNNGYNLTDHGVPLYPIFGHSFTTGLLRVYFELLYTQFCLWRYLEVTDLYLHSSYTLTTELLYTQIWGIR